MEPQVRIPVGSFPTFSRAVGPRPAFKACLYRASTRFPRVWVIHGAQLTSSTRRTSTPVHVPQVQFFHMQPAACLRAIGSSATEVRLAEQPTRACLQLSCP